MIPEERDPFVSSELKGAFYEAIEEVNDTIVRVSNGGIRDVSFSFPTFIVPASIQSSTEMTPIRELLQEFTPFLAELGDTEVRHLGVFTVPDLFNTDYNSERGKIEESSPLRAEDDSNDTMGADTDPGRMGAAESWFRKMRGDAEEAVATESADERCPDDCPCRTPETMPF